MGEIVVLKVMVGCYSIVEINFWIFILFFCFVFVVGVSIGFWWSGFYIILRVEIVEFLFFLLLLFFFLGELCNW